MTRDKRQKNRSMQALADVLSALPDDAERSRLLMNLDVITKFFGDLRRRLETLPSSNERTKVQNALNEIAGFLDRSRENQVLSQALGIAYERAPNRASTPPRTTRP